MTVVVTHGNLLALLLGLGHDGWAALRNPDVWLWMPGARRPAWVSRRDPRVSPG